MALDMAANSWIKYLTMSLLFITGLALALPVLAADKTPSPTYALEFKGKVGRWSSEAALELVIEYQKPGDPAHSMMNASLITFDEAIKEIRPNGNRVETNRATRIRQSKQVDGAGMTFDSDNPQDLAWAGSDPAMRPVLAVLKTPVSYVRDKRGRMVDYAVDSEDQTLNQSATEMAGETMSRDAIVFPAGPIAIGQSWEADKRDIPYGALGSLQFTVKGILSRVETRNGKTHAQVTFTGENPVFAGAGNFRDLKLRNFSYTSSAEYDFEAGRMIVIEQNQRIELASDTKDAAVIKGEMRASSRDTGTESTAWLVAPTPSLISNKPAAAAPAGKAPHAPRPEWLACFGPENTPVEQRMEGCSRIIEAGSSNPESTGTDNLAHAYYTRAMIHAELAEMDQALNDMAAMIKIQPDFVAYATRAELYRHNGKYELAIADADRAIALDPSNVRIRLLKGFSHAKLGRYAEGVQDCNDAMVIAPNDPSVYGVRGEIKLHAGDKAGGEEDLAKAAALERK